MRWFYIAGLVVSAAAVCVFRNYQRAAIENIYGKQRGNGIISCFLRVGSWVKKDIKKEEMQLRNLCPMGNPAELCMKEQIKWGRLIMFCWCFIHLSGLLCSFVFVEKSSIYGEGFIQRQSDDGVSKTIIASAYGESFCIEDIPVEVRDRLVYGEERKELFERGKDYVLEMVKGENQSLDEVRFRLNLITSIPKTSMTVEWQLDAAPNVMPDGGLAVSEVSEDGSMQVVKAILGYGGEEWSFDIRMRVYPPKKTNEEKALDEIKEKLSVENDVEQNSAVFKLPEYILGQKVSWIEKSSNKSEKAAAAAGIFTVAFVIYISGEKKRKLKVRSEQLIDDYPKFIHKLVLLTSAGLNMRNALETMVENERNRGENKMHYVYQETAAALKMMQQGISEVKAYEMLGKYCGERMYIKLSGMMVQCVKKGAAGMNDLMSDMANEALMVHKEQVRQKGEQAGTKLLMPMGIILIVVLMILVIPAFLSMNL